MKRFKTGVNLLYDNEYVSLKNSSEILGGNSPFIPGEFTTFWDRKQLEYTLADIQGDEKGLSAEGKTLASIPYTKERLKNLEAEFQGYCDQKENQGYERPTEMLPEMVDKQIRLFARLDILEEEVISIKKKIESYQDVVDKEDDRKMLYYGLMCQVKLTGGVIDTIDGQKCGRTKEVILIIDSRSPYSGMLVSDYRKLAKTWQEQRKQSDREHLKIIQAEALAAGKDIPRYYRSFSGSQAVKKSLLPDWPTGVKNYLEDIAVVRTK